MGKMKKIGVCAVAVVGVAGIEGITAKVIEDVRRKWFSRGFETGKIVGNLTAVESFARDKVVIQQKLDKLREEYDELQNEFNDMLDYYNED